ncbi:hypothetical protein NC651_014120 [Populus alba x Populus x berolinensis]|nr:hypothetical protein NC651_014120 [Populus alba x Populus x berolinensis]
MKETTNSLNILPEETQAGSTEEHPNMSKRNSPPPLRSALLASQGMIMSSANFNCFSCNIVREEVNVGGRNHWWWL